MTPFNVIEKKLRENMVEGEMHSCLRDVGRTAGGFLASGALTVNEVDQLGAIAQSMSINNRDAIRKWDEGISFGREQPIKWDERSSHRYASEDRAYDWNQEIPTASLKVVESAWLEEVEIKEPGDEWNPKEQIIDYLATLFNSNEHVGYVTESWKPEGTDRHIPNAGHCDRTAEQLIKKLKRTKDIGNVLGDYEESCGAWIRFNPLDGKGVKDKNVTDFRYALIESDCMSVPKQVALLRKLELPIKILVHSGGKSAHAIVMVDAETYDQYQERVDFLYKVCKENGLEMDRQNRNPSRLSRLPGITRNGKKQFIIDKNIGKASFEEWKEWIEEQNDELPDIEVLDIEGDEPELAPELISGVLREGHKLLIAGPSKAGKSFNLIQLCHAMANGGKWLGYDVKKGKCLYVNLELDKLSSKHRFWRIGKESGFAPNKNIHVWNLRGSATTMDKLTPKLIRRAKKENYKAIIIDPIYKVLTGDENSAEQMAHFTNQFDKIAVELGAAVIYCHHHSKGSQGQKNHKDRSSGSGVFARDPDAIMDLIELEITEEKRKALTNRWECDAMSGALVKLMPGWASVCPQDDAIVADPLMKWAIDQGFEKQVIQARIKGREMAESVSGWRIESTFREFPPSKPIRCFFRYPIHVMDDGDMLMDAKAEGEDPPWQKTKKEKDDAKEDRKTKRLNDLGQAFAALDLGDPVKVTEVADYLNLSPKTIERTIKEHPTLQRKNGIVFQKQGPKPSETEEFNDKTPF